MHALRGIELELLRGDVVELLGPSGSGKSTLLNIWDGLDADTAGSVGFVGNASATLDICTLSATKITHDRRGTVGFVFLFYNLIPSLTARENIDLVAGALPADEVLGLVGLGARADHFPSELSGGEQQRVAIARPLVKRPPLMLCEVDPISRTPSNSKEDFTARLIKQAPEGAAP